MAKTARADMFLDLADDPREIRPPMTDERSTLVGYLRDQRYTLEIKCSGLDADGMAARSVPPSTMSLLGLVRHMTEVERNWFRRYMAGGDAPPRYYSADDPDGDFDGAVADPAVVEEAWAAWREECAWTDAFVAAAPDLELRGSRPSDMHTNLRQVLLHLIEEYARHNGHADLLRELVDGRVGQ
jgi:uncharacterized damage-inducible protein DinB